MMTGTSQLIPYVVHSAIARTLSSVQDLWTLVSAHHGDGVCLEILIVCTIAVSKCVDQTLGLAYCGGAARAKLPMCPPSSCDRKLGPPGAIGAWVPKL